METHHGDFSTPQLRLLARMIVLQIGNLCERALQIFQHLVELGTPKRSQQQSFSDAISGAAVAFARALKNDHETTPTRHARTTTTGGTCISPANVVDLRMKNFEQLRYLQQLFDDDILSLAEYTEQKDIILCALRNL